MLIKTKIAVATLVPLLATLSANSAALAGTFRRNPSLETFDERLNKHKEYADNFSFVGSLALYSSEPFGGASICSGTLINPSWILTSAHCMIKPSKNEKKIAGIFQSEGSKRTITGGVVYKKYLINENNFDYDIGLYKLDSPISNIPSVLPYTGNSENGNFGSLVGFGAIGEGLTGHTGKASLTRRLGGRNRLNVENGLDPGRGLFYDFDHHMNTNKSDRDFNTYASNLEFNLTSGDSGGGVFLGGFSSKFGQDFLLAGVHSRSYPLPGRKKGQYGTLGYATRVSPYAGWIGEVISKFDSVAPPPVKLTPSVFKIKLGASQDPYLDESEVDEVIESNEFKYQFELTPDIFLEEFNQEIYDTVFKSNLSDNPDQKTDPNPNPNPTPTSIPEPSSVLGILIFSVFGIGSALNRKQGRASSEFKEGY